MRGFAKFTTCFPYIPAQSKNKLYLRLRNAASVTSCEAALKNFALASLIADNCFFYANLGAHRTANLVVGRVASQALLCIAMGCPGKRVFQASLVWIPAKNNVLLDPIPRKTTYSLKFLLMPKLVFSIYF